MKAILEFNLPEEASDHLHAVHGTSTLLVIHDLLDEIRSKLKHDSGYFGAWRDEDGKEMVADYATLERVREFLNETMLERNIPSLD